MANTFAGFNEYAPLSMDRYITGLVTNRSVLRDAAVPYVYERSGGRTDSILDGLNVELTERLTLARSPGHTVYNSGSFPPIGRFYEHRIVVDGISSIRVIADTAGTVYDATGPSTKTALLTKAATDGKSCFQSVGNTLYISTGSLQKKWMLATTAWAPGKTFNAGQWIVDPNNNVQQLLPQKTASIANVSVASNVVTILFSGPSPFPTGTPVMIAGVGQADFLNGATLVPSSVAIVNGIQAPFAHKDYAAAVDVGTVTSGLASGATGAGQPNWATTLGAYTSDGQLQWLCRGSSIQNWGIQSPAVASSVTQAALPKSAYPGWTADTYYSTSLALVDKNGNIQVLTTGGTTGSAEPTWSTVAGTTTADGTAIWTNNGTAAWQPNTAFLAGSFVQIQYTYYVQTYVYNQQDYNGQYGYNQQQSGGYYVSTPVTVTEVFKCTYPGQSGASAPAWSSAPGVGTFVADNTVTWTNAGSGLTWATLGAATNVSLAQQIVDTNGYLQNLTTPGKSGAINPFLPVTITSSTGISTTTLAVETPGTATADGSVVWTNAGTYSAANTKNWFWAFSYGNSIDGSVSSTSPQSISILLGQGNVPVLQGACSTDPQVDTIYMWRVNQGGGLLLYLDKFTQPTGATWTYQDTSPDADLVAEIEAPIDGVNDPPPTGITALAYHLGRVWAAVENAVSFCTGPDITVGNESTAWKASNRFSSPDSIYRLLPVTLSNGALLLWSASDLLAINGLGTTVSPFLPPTTYAAGVGVMSADCVDVVGATIYAFTTSLKVVSLDPSAGYSEVGQPIGDQFEAVTTGGINPTAFYSATGAYVTWHEAGTGDTALYVSDGSEGWFRYAPISAPETGFMWSPRRAVQGGTSAVSSVEVSPGQRALLVGPAAAGPILMRNKAVNSDNGVPYSETYATIGSIQIAQSGEIAELSHIALDSKRVGTAPVVSLLLGEIAPTVEVPFAPLERTSADPVNLPQSVTLFNDRFSCLQDGLCPLCRHFQMRLDWAVEDEPSELLQHTIYGAKYAERTTAA